MGVLVYSTYQNRQWFKSSVPLNGYGARIFCEAVVSKFVDNESHKIPSLISCYQLIIIIIISGKKIHLGQRPPVEIVSKVKYTSILEIS